MSFYNRFVEIDELIEFIGMADIYVTPYLNPAQITSGTLAYAFGCGKAVVSTPYWYAEELLADGRGVLVPFGDSAALAREICELLRDEPRRHAMRKKAYMLGREMIWSHVAHLYMESFQRARRSRARHALQAAGRPHAGRAADGPARLAARPPGADDRLGRHAPARQLHDPQLRRGLLHRRQRPRPAPDRAAGAARPELRADPSAGDDLRGVPELRLRPRPRAGSATSWASTAAGSRTSARTTATAGRSGRWGLASAGRGAATSSSGPRSSSSWPCRRSPR